MFSGGDGSTLSLDFTAMSSLDSRFTFTRASDATFVNSSGFVQYADANHVRNSTMLVSTSWTQTSTGTGATTINGDGSVRFNGSGGRATWLQTITLAAGLQTTFSFRVTAFTNTDLRTSDLFTAGFGFTGQQYFYTDENGTTHSLTAFESLPKTGTNGLGVYSCTATTTGTSCNIIFGADCNAVGRLGDVTIRDPQVQYGTVVPRRAYIPNSSTISAKWDSVRFDYDPSTLAPRGLLIEGSATNLATRSEEIMNAVGNWIVGQNTTNTQNTTDLLDPAGTNKATKVVCNANAYCSLAQAISVSGNTQYTFSYWIRGTAGNDNRIYSYAGFTGELTARSAYSYSTTGWTRVQVTFTTNAATTAIYVYAISKQTAPATSDTLYVWGAQLEAGPSASSYIPTGTSQVQRTGDICYITPNTSWFNLTEGTVLQETAVSYSATSGYNRLFAFVSQTASGFSVSPQSISLGVDASTSRPFLNLTESSTNRGDAFIPVGAGTITQGTFFKLSSCYKQGDYRISRAGTSGTLTYSATYPTSLPTLYFNGIDGAPHRAVWYRSFKYFPTRLSNAQMDAWSA
jgi:hypothetical protein